MEDIDKMVTEVARKAVKEFLENLMNTERDVFLMENNGQKNGYYRRSMKTRMGEIRDLNFLWIYPLNKEQESIHLYR